MSVINFSELFLYRLPRGTGPVSITIRISRYEKRYKTKIEKDQFEEVGEETDQQTTKNRCSWPKV